VVVLDRTTADFGQRLRQARVARGWTQRVLAERAGLGMETVHVLERGRKRPRSSTTTLLGMALGVPVAGAAAVGRRRR
jgi:transcriptional regulator with XRE-family HTH domain